MKLYQEGDPKGFATLYERHSHRVYSFLRRRLSKAEEVNEVYQEVFLKLHKSKELYDPQSKFLPWLYVITKSVCFDHLRKKQNMKESLFLNEDLSDLKSDSSSQPNATGTLDFELESVTKNLTAEQKEVLRLRYWEDEEFKEIAKLLNKNEVSIRKTLSRAITKLKTQFKPEKGKN